MTRRGRPTVVLLAQLALLTFIGCSGKPDAGDDLENASKGGAKSSGGASGTTGPSIFASGGSSVGASTGTGGPTLPTARCGNGVVEAGEVCDDANGVDGDGCSASCQLEANAQCPATGGLCEVCGNGVKESSEGCDDGNAVAADGCSSSCTVEQGYDCDVPGKACHACGNAVREGTEICDDGNTLENDGCSADCKKVGVGYNCPVQGGACSLCGDGIHDANEACDDGNRYSLDGCLFNCKAVEEGYSCPPAGGACEKCGDGRKTGTEQCDDFNATDGDGCSSSCKEEAGHICVTLGFFSYCYACGNGKQEGAITEAHETCDDGNLDSDDGCSSVCQLEVNANWVCPLPGQHCLACGNGKLEGTAQDLIREECDDGNQTSNDGCSATCQLEPGAVCLTPGAHCVLCGDGHVSAAAGEQCDDGNRTDRDGCSSKCQIETGWTCPAPNPTTGAGTKCNACGNGRLEADSVEQCDDGNIKNADGCSSECLVEPGWNCQLLTGTVRSICDTCGNGRHPLEQCDDGNSRDNDGCSATCTLETGFSCPEPGGIQCNSCGNSIREGLELCDAGSFNGAGCVSDCTAIAEGWSCPVDGQPCEQCGDGTKDAHELCDDGNRNDSDGCSANCQTVRPGWLCPEGVNCTQCGNARLDAGEECDDGSATGADGCANCAEEAGWDCFPSIVGDASSRSNCDPCGNGVVRGSEERCDDGNRTDNDGCSQTCQIESTAWYCPPEGGVCRNCGDGRLQRGEVCDTGSMSNSGCTNCTTIEPNWYCATAGQACAQCGDGVVSYPEVCDNGLDGSGVPASNDGCRSDCRQIEPGWLCNTSGGACTLCGNGKLDASEGCDDGNQVGSDGCSAVCQAEGAPYHCADPGLPCERCGNARVEAHEACDDGNTTAGDGCENDCSRLTTNWSCPIPGVPCNLCGDKVLQGAEQCDDGNTTAGDGCSKCTLDPGWTCEGSSCLAVRCGDGHVAGSEVCDDNNIVGGDGCSTRCTVETGWHCPKAGGACVKNVCGDKLVGGTEQCDDGNIAADDGCNNCVIETTCGDKRIGGAEQCDDGQVPPANGDGCSSTCQWETGWICVGDPGAYSCTDGDTCGNGTRGNTELCDDGNPAAGDGCSSSCTLESFYNCSGDANKTSTCTPLFQWVVLRSFDVSSVDPVGIHYDPLTRSFVGYKTQTSQNIVELCLDGTLLNHPIKTDGAICLPNQACKSPPPITQANWPTAIGVRNYPLLYGSLADATYDARTSTWYFMDSSVLYRVSTLPRLPAVPTALSNLAQAPLTGSLDRAMGVTIGDDGRMYVAIHENGSSAFIGIRAFDRSSTDPVGFDFSTVKDSWLVSGSDNLKGLVNLAGFGAVAAVNALPDSDTYSDLRAYDTRTTNADFGQSTIPGTLFAKTDVYGRALPLIAGYLLANAADAMESTTDGSGFIVCTENNSENCFLFAQVCSTDADCTSGATCQKGTGIVVPYCSAVGKAREDFASTSIEKDVAIDVLANDTRSEATCRDTSFAISSVGTSLYGGIPRIANGSADCGSAATCIVYEPPDDGTCNIIDQFTYTVNLGGGQTGTALVRVTVTCKCGNGTVDPGEQCDGGANCSSTCKLIPVCGNAVVEGAEFCDDGNTTSGDGCTWDCRREGCGNGTLDTTEQCDDGNTSNGDGCRGNCTTEICGDGLVDPGEQCDDKNTVETDGCLQTCIRGPVCGDGQREGIEQCDDGDDIDTNACRNDCILSFCGDSIVNNTEECDHGGTANANCSWNCLNKICGNGRLDDGEACDDSNVVSGDGCSSTCTKEGCGNGVLEAGEACDYAIAGQAEICRSNCTLRRCGDFIRDPGEGCDDGDTTAGDGCSATCQVEGFCGDGTIDANEECDYLNDPACNNLCLRTGCGNGYVEAGEECDDGNSIDTDGCRSDCRIPRCGDGVTDTHRGERCDDGANNGATATSCSLYCVLPAVCGNGVLEGNEQCDDGNSINTDGCTSDCRFAGCGNGQLDPGESCDPTAPVTTSLACRNDCTVPACGDRLIDAGEQCDDGNLASGDGCSSTCLLETVCGDGRREDPEKCDDGNQASGDGCSSSCYWEYCGNGIRDVDAGGTYVEACDDGNNTSGDGCSSVCTQEPICGDNKLEAPEQCDDGNTATGDGCSPYCRIEAYCGDGRVGAGEECDWAAPGASDCSRNCTIESILF